MQITIFGGTGSTGLLTIKKALNDGHRVIAYTRNPDKITFDHANLRIEKGELHQFEKIVKAVAGSDAVISLIGPNKVARGTPISDGYRNIISAMTKSGPKRLISVVSSSYKDPHDKFQFMVFFGVKMIGLLAPGILRDIETMGDLIRYSALEWTMIRVPVLKHIPAKRHIHIGYAGDGQFNFWKLSRENLAAFLLTQLEDKTYLNQAPAISN